MRIVCDNCSAKYQISDEKVRNKVFKIRCKKCSHVIVVSGKKPSADQAAEPKAAEQQAPEPQQAPAAAAADASAVWYVVVNREQVGPLTPSAVGERVEAGDVSADTFGWREGMGDWTRLGSIPEFKAFFASAAPVAASPEAAASPFAGMDSQTGGEEDVMASDNAAASGGAGAAVAAASPGLQPTEALPAADDDHDGGRVSGNLREQRNENSVLFSLDMLHDTASGGGGGGGGAPARAPSSPASAPAPAPVPASNTTAAGGASGLIDISAMMGGGPAPAAAAAGGVAAAPSPSFSEPPGAVAPLVTQPRSSGSKWVAIAAVAVLLLGGGGFALWKFVLSDGDTNGTQVASNTKPANQEPAKVQVAGGGAPVTPPPKPAAPTPPPEQPKPATAAPAADPVAAAANQEKPAETEKPAEAVVAKADPPKPTKRSRSRSRSTSRRRRTASKPKSQPEDAPSTAVAAAPPPPPKPAPSRSRSRSKPKEDGEIDDLLGALDNPNKNSRSRRRSSPPKPSSPPPAAADPLLPEKLTKSQILGVVKKNAARVQSCRSRQPGASGTVKVALRIGRNGRVASANVKDGQFKGTPVGDCVERTVKAFQFPAFSGPPIPVSLPFRL